MHWLRQQWAKIGFEKAWNDLRADGPFRCYVFLFVALVLTVPLAAEPLFRLSELAWDWIGWPGWALIAALAFAFVAGVAALAILVVLVRRAIASKAPRKSLASSAIPAGIVIVVALLLIESVLGEIVIRAAEALPDAGAWQFLLLIEVFLVLSVAAVLLAAVTVRNVKELTGVRLVNRINEAKERPAAWPARVVICALSVPAKSLTANDGPGRSTHKLPDYMKYAGADVASRFRLFADPEGTAAATGRNPASAAEFVERFNWRQIALAYDEQIDGPYSLETLPRLILLCSSESREHIDKFRDFFKWLLEPLNLAEPESYLEFICGYEDEKREEKEIDFEDLDSIAKVLRTVYEAQCKEHGAEKVIIDITGAQRPWTLAALEATLDTEKRKHCVFSYVAQKPFTRDAKRSWVRYYDIEAKDVEMTDTVAETVGAD